MADTSPERSYKYQVPADVFVEAFTTPKWTPAQTKKFNAVGIERLKGFDLKRQYSEIEHSDYDDNEDYTVVTSCFVDGDITIVSIKDVLPYLVIFKSRLFDINIRNCNTGHSEKRNKIHINDSVIDNLWIHSSVVGDFFVNDSNIRDINIREKSDIGRIKISGSVIGEVSAFHKASIKDFSLFTTTIKHCHINKSSFNDFWIYGCTISEFLLDGSSTGCFLINGSSTGNFCITNSCKCGNFTFEGDGKCGTQHFEIEKNSSIGNLKANNHSFYKLTIENSHTGVISFESVNIESLKIWGDSSAKGFDFYDTNFSKFFEAEYIYSGVRVSKSSIPYAKITYSNIPELKIEGGSRMDLYFDNVSINALRLIKTNLSKDTNLSFSTCTIYYCLIREFAVLGNLYFRDIKHTFEDKLVIEKIEHQTEEEKQRIEKQNQRFSYQKNQYKIEIDKLMEEIHKPTFRISQSSLGKTEFTNCDLDSFNFEFNNSKITEVFISGDTVPENVKVYGETNPIKVLEQKKSFFDQLKKVFENQGDIVRGTKYHAKASAIQMKILWSQKNIAELLVYVFNWLSNKHGESWLRGFCFIVVIAGLFFWGYNWALVPDKYDFVGWSNIFQWESWRFLADYVKFIDVTHKFNFMVENPNPRAIVVDFVARIFIVYGIYQMVAAFRKHGKRG